MSHLPDTWWGSSNMGDNCSSLTIALCLLLFPFSLLPFPLLVSRQKNRKKKIDTDRNLSYYIAECPKHETENRTFLCVYLFIYSFILSLPFFSCLCPPVCNSHCRPDKNYPFSLWFSALFFFFSYLLSYFPLLCEHLDILTSFCYGASDFSKAASGRLWSAWSQNWTKLMKICALMWQNKVSRA